MMAASKGQVVYVLSVVPRLAQLVQESLPNVEVINVKRKVESMKELKKELQEEEVEVLQEAEVLLADNHLLAEITHRLPKLHWAQGTWAGVEGLVDSLKGKPKPSYPITRMVGDAFGQLMAEHTIGFIINHERDWFKSNENQAKCQWVKEGKISDYRSLQDLTVGVLGMGAIGKEVARCLNAFRSTVHAYTRSPPSDANRCGDVDKYWHTGELASLLQQCDYIVNIMPSTQETRGMLDGNVLKDAKEGAVFINIGRGDVVSEAALVRSLDAGWLSAAILDVFVKEPLPQDSPLWTHPKVEITPHNAGISRPEDVTHTFNINYKRYCQGLPVLNPIDWNFGY